MKQTIYGFPSIISCVMSLPCDDHMMLMTRKLLNKCHLASTSFNRIACWRTELEPRDMVELLCWETSDSYHQMYDHPTRRLLCAGHSAAANVSNTYLKPDGAEAETVDLVGTARPRHHCSCCSAVASPSNSMC